MSTSYEWRHTSQAHASESKAWDSNCPNWPLAGWNPSPDLGPGGWAQGRPSEQLHWDSPWSLRRHIGTAGRRCAGHSRLWGDASCREKAMDDVFLKNEIQQRSLGRKGITWTLSALPLPQGLARDTGTDHQGSRDPVPIRRPTLPSQPQSPPGQTSVEPWQVGSTLATLPTVGLLLALHA